MTADQLNKMQEGSIKRHAIVLDESLEFFDECVRPRRKTKKLLRDLMAAQIPLPCTSEQKEIPVIKKQEVMGTSTKVWDSMFDKPHTPAPVQKKEIIRSKNTPLEPERQRWERPPAVYSNSRTHYGIYDELKEEMFKKS